MLWTTRSYITFGMTMVTLNLVCKRASNRRSMCCILAKLVEEAPRVDYDGDACWHSERQTPRQLYNRSERCLTCRHF